MYRREYTKEYDGNTRPFIIEQFESFTELTNVCNSRKRNFGTDKFRADGVTFDDPDWVGCKSLTEAENMLRYGWDDREKIRYIKDKISTLSKIHEVEKTGFYDDIVGFVPVVPKAILGIPQSMVNTTRKAKKNKVITILADMTVSAGTPTQDYLDWGAELIAKIVQLEKNGYRVRLEYVNTFSRDGYEKVHVCRVLMKSENQPFDIKRYMFPLAHTGMFRGLMFDWYHKLPNATRLSGYGVSLVHHDEDQEFIKSEIADLDNCYYIICKEDVEEKLKDVK